MNKYYINLQLFSGEKTEKPTQKKKEDARRKGQVAKSTEVNSAVVLLVTMIFLKVFMKTMILNLEGIFTSFLEFSSTQSIDVIYVMNLYVEILGWFVKIVLPILLISMLGGLIANYIQVGFLFSTDSIKFKPEKLNPISGLKKMFSKRTLVEMLKSIFKISVILYLAYISIVDKVNDFPKFLDMDIQSSIMYIGDLIYSVIWKVLIFLIILAIVDFIFQRYDFQQSLKMSKQEIKDEYKNIEGDPMIKSKIKEKQRQMAMGRMMDEVPSADVVITNPTHFAVALKYSEEMGAPIVIAKGQDRIALKIKEKAKENDIILYEDRPLARGLYYNVDIGDEIPEDMFQAVAEVLAYVYRIKKKI